MDIKERFLMKKRVRKQAYIEPEVWSTLSLVADKKLHIPMNELTRNILWDAYYEYMDKYPDLNVNVKKGGEDF
jgi:hypothetical protein